MQESLQIGSQAPAFELTDQNNQLLRLSDMLGKNVILYFYPKDDTPGCTREAQEFSQLSSEFTKLNTVVIGVSPDNIESHQKFVNKYNINFSLGSDTDQVTCQAYNVWGEKSFFGKKISSAKRTTFWIDERGYVKHIWQNVKAEGHAQQVLNLLKTA